MLLALAKNATNGGIRKENICILVNGQKAQLLNHVLTATDEFVDMYEVYIDGNKINSNTTDMLKYRQVLSQDGIFSVVLHLDRKAKKILEQPIINTRGCFYTKTSLPLITKIAYTIKENIEEAMKKNPNPLEIPSIKKICEKTVEYFI
jgi:ribonuclease J